MCDEVLALPAESSAPAVSHYPVTWLCHRSCALRCAKGQCQFLASCWGSHYPEPNLRLTLQLHTELPALNVFLNEGIIEMVGRERVSRRKQRRAQQQLLGLSRAHSLMDFCDPQAVLSYFPTGCCHSVLAVHICVCCCTAS